MMTDSVTIRQGACTITLYLSMLPRLPKLPIKNIRTLFAMVLSDPQTNEDAIDALGLFLEEAVAVSRADWSEASRTYQNEWRLIEEPVRDRTQALIRAHNNKLLKQLKHAKASHERWVKIQTIWNDTKH